MTLEQLDLIAMPLVWSRWMFTLERRETEGPQMVLIRRELPVRSMTSSPGTDSHTRSAEIHPSRSGVG